MGRPRECEQLMTAKQRRDLRALRVLVAGGSPTQAAARIGVDKGTIYRRGLVRKAREIRVGRERDDPDHQDPPTTERR